MDRGWKGLGWAKRKTAEEMGSELIEALGESKAKAKG